MSKAAVKKGQVTVFSDDVVDKALAAATEAFRTMTPKEAFQLAIRAGIYTKDGKLTAPYRPPRAKKR